jgi:asparagine synthase (glutamine-hydrolysing)
MCGILGTFNMDASPPKIQLIEELLGTINHRGPDAKNIARMDNVVFGNTRLSIIGISTIKASLPINDDFFMLAFNGEIYNYKELNKILIQNNISVEGKSDSETLFLFLKNFGIDKTLKVIDGMYAFAFYDKENKIMYIARDKIGERFVYWSLSNKCLIFASEIKSIIKSKLCAVQPNLNRIDDYLYTAKVNGSETIFDNIQELEAGTYLSIKKGQSKPKIFNYWKIEDSFDCSDNNFDKDFLNNFSSAVNSRLVSDVPASFLLSGGIDSNALVAQSLENSNISNIDLFFCDNENSEFSEYQDVKRSVSFFKNKFKDKNLILNTHKTSYEEYMQELEEVAWFYDEPIQFVNTMLLSKICSKIKDKNYKVCLSGEGSDELLFGYNRFVNTFNKIRNMPLTEDKLKLLYFGGGMHSVPVIENLTNNSGVMGYSNTEPWLWLKNNINRDVNQLQLLYSQKYRLQMLLQRQDRIGMMHSIEIRTPFLAPKFISYVNNLSIKEKYNQNNQETKVILKRAMKNLMPDEIINKKKQGFPSDMLNWISTDKMKSVVTETIKNSNSFCNSYLDGNYANQIVEEHFEGKRDFSTLVWNIFSLEIWHKKFFL